MYIYMYRYMHRYNKDSVWIHICIFTCIFVYLYYTFGSTIVGYLCTNVIYFHDMYVLDTDVDG